MIRTVRFDGNSELVAELVTANGFKSAYAIKDGAEGPRGWMVCYFSKAIVVLLSFEFKCKYFNSHFLD